MKKIFITVSLVSLFTAGAYAQGLSGGLKVGANFSNQKLSAQGESESLDSKVGFQVGGYLTSMITDKFGIQPELLYSGMGAKAVTGVGETVTGASGQALGLDQDQRGRFSRVHRLSLQPDHGSDLFLLSPQGTARNRAPVA